MIHRPEYVKYLLQKYLEGTASPIELARWEAARNIYTGQEIARMTEKILREKKETITEKQIAAYLAEPDQTLIQIPPEPYPTKDWRKFNKMVALLCAMVAATVLLTATYTLIRGLNDHVPGIACPGIIHEGDITTSAFLCDLSLGKDSSLVIDSNTRGTVGRIENIIVTQKQPGLLEFYLAAEPRKAAISANTFITATTGPQQQYQLRLPDGTRIRLNASSFIRLPVMQWNDNTEKSIEIGGEAYIETVAGNHQMLTIKTSNAIVTTDNAALNIQTATQFTSAALIKGECQLSNHAGKSISMKCPGDKGFFVEFDKSQNANSDTLALTSFQDMNRELMWMKTERVYKHTPAREFAEEMSRWYGFTIKNLNCIPENSRISTNICYRASLQEVFSVFRKAGLPVYQSKSMISFCDPVQNKVSGKERNLMAHIDDRRDDEKQSAQSSHPMFVPATER